jgi:hypothetical protein
MLYSLTQTDLYRIMDVQKGFTKVALVLNLERVLSAGGTTGIRFPVGTRDFSRFHRIQTGPGAHPVSYAMCTAVRSPSLKRLSREADNSSASSSEVENSGAIISMPPHDFLTWCLIK